ncbi:MAG: histidine phosphatase family protein [Rhodospirillaceae bacterium]|nr:histidine phosphatase family protein [Rhodospirillaceae bacterium]
MSRLIVLRHAATAWTPEHRLQGRRDLPLSPEGEAEAAAWVLAPVLTDWAMGEVEWATSPLARAVMTATLMGSEPVAEPAWIEQDYGAWEGRRLADLRAADPAGMAAIEADGLDYRPPGGESPREVMLRLYPWLAGRARQGDTTVVVTHKGVLRALLALATGWTMAGPPPVRLANGCAHVVELDASGHPTLLATNLALLPEEVA